MDFFAQQDVARRHTTLLVFLFLLAVLAIVLAVNLIAAIAYTGIAPQITGRSVDKLPAGFHFWVSLATLSIICIGSVVEFIGMAKGGPAVARMMGARPVAGSSTDPGERRLLNVVEEMAIASGISVPQVFVMDEQSSVNAFAAGFSPNSAAVVVTRGLLTLLNRDELQGVVGHEFSHIFNGDMRLNMRLMGVLGGILVLATLGRMIADISSRGESKAWPLVLMGVGLVAVGYIGVFFGRIIQAGVSRQREFLADASSVQFTRNPEGIGGALAKIGHTVNGGLIQHPRVDEASHMFFGQANELRFAGMMATHPPIAERLERIYGRRVTINEVLENPAHKFEPDARPAQVSAFAGGETFGRGGGSGDNGGTAAKLTTTAAAIVSAVGAVSTRHVDYAAALLDGLPTRLRELARDPAGARQAMFALVLEQAGPVRQTQLDLLTAAAEDAGQIAETAARIRESGRTARLPLIALATPALKSLDAQQRAKFLALLAQLMAADRRITLEEFVLGTMLESALGPRAGRAVMVKYRKLEALAGDAQLLLSLMAHAATGDDAAAFAAGMKEAGLSLPFLEAREVTIATVKAALSRLNQLAPMQKPRLVKALCGCALADGKLNLMEAELLRALCVTLDSPLPPFIESMAYA